MNNKYGFTLIELIAVIAILGILAILTGPAVLKIFNKSKIDAIEIQEKNIADAAVLFKKDFCDRPISSNYKKYCNVDKADNETLLKKNGNDYFVCAADLIALEYIDFVPEYSSVKCAGYVSFSVSSNGKYDESKTYLTCDDAYKSDNFDKSILGRCEPSLVQNAKSELNK